MDLFNNDNLSEVGTQTTDTKDNKKDLSFSDMSSIDHKEDETVIDIIQDISVSSPKKKRKLTKEDLETIPLPLFECMYCSNELITYQHLSRQILSSKYWLLTSIFDILKITSLIEKCPISFKSEEFMLYRFDYDFQRKISLMLIEQFLTRKKKQ